jgi:hypothetical protein
MSFCAAELSVLAYANGFTHWHYRTADPLERILRPGSSANDDCYFAAAGEMLRPGDQITLNLIGPVGIDIAQLAVTAVPIPARPQLRLIGASLQPAPERLAAA